MSTKLCSHREGAKSDAPLCGAPASAWNPLTNRYACPAHADADGASEPLMTKQGLEIEVNVTTADDTPKFLKRVSKANERQVAGTHYQGIAIQPWDAIHAWGLGYFDGCAVKYVARWKRKGHGVQDLKKAIHYLEKLIELEEAK